MSRDLVSFIAGVNNPHIRFWFVCDYKHPNESCLHYKSAGPPPFDYCLWRGSYPLANHCECPQVNINCLHYLAEKAEQELVNIAMSEEERVLW